MKPILIIIFLISPFVLGMKSINDSNNSASNLYPARLPSEIWLLIFKDVPDSYKLGYISKDWYKFLPAVLTTVVIKTHMNMEYLSKFENISYLKLENELFDKEYHFLTNFKSLKTLILKKYYFGHEAFDLSISKLSNLQTLKLKGVKKIDDDSIESISNLFKLKKLDICGVKSSVYRCEIIDIYNEDISGLTKITQLQDLMIKGSNIDSLEFISSLTNLKNLTVRGVNFEDNTYIGLGLLTNLRNLKIDSSDGRMEVDDNGIKNFTSLKNLKDLTLDICEITLDGLKHLTCIQSLRILGLKSFEDDKIVAEFKELKNIFKDNPKIKIKLFY